MRCEAHRALLSLNLLLGDVGKQVAHLTAIAAWLALGSIHFHIELTAFQSGGVEVDRILALRNAGLVVQVGLGTYVRLIHLYLVLADHLLVARHVVANHNLFLSRCCSTCQRLGRLSLIEA